jgi:hypothetical protein
MDWRLDHLRRSTTGAAVNEPVYVLELHTDSSVSGRAPATSSVSFGAGREQLQALLRSVTEALESADRVVLGAAK